MENKLNKEGLISCIRGIPADLLKSAYAFRWSEVVGYQLQMKFNSGLLRKHKPEASLVINNTGYLYWNIAAGENRNVEIVMTGD